MTTLDHNEGDDMTDVLLFHHIQGLTPGVIAFADELRAAGHTVHTPDLFDGRTFESIEAGQGYLREVGFEKLGERAVAVADALPPNLVYAGFSLGVMPAQQLAQTRPGARGALLFHACAPVKEFGTWPAGLPAQIHGMDADPFFADEGDLDAAHELVEQQDSVELFVYPGDQHLFADNSLASYVPGAAALLTRRTLDFLTAL